MLRRRLSAAFGIGKRDDVDNRAPQDVTPGDKPFDTANIKSGEWADEFLENYNATRDPVKYSVSLWRVDALVMLIEFLQTYALLLLIAADQRAWPQDWFEGTYFAFASNVDVLAMVTHSRYSRDAAQPIKSGSISVPFTAYFWAWLAAAAAVGGLYFLIARQIAKTDKVLIAKRMLNLRVAYLFLLQVLCMPLGLVLARTAHCVEGQVVDADVPFGTLVATVNNEWECFGGSHLAVFVPGLLLFITLVPFISHRLYVKIEGRVFHHEAPHHEVYLRLKEMEFVQNTDYSWADGAFYAFSSFRLPWVYSKPLGMATKALMLVGFAIGPHYGEAALQAHICVITVAIFAQFSMACMMQYRVRASNWINILLQSANLCNVTLLLMHVFRQNYQNALLENAVLGKLLMATNGAFFFGAVFAFAVAEIRAFSWASGKPIWPVTFDPDSTRDQSEDFREGLNLSPAAAKRFQEQLQIIAAGRRIIADCATSPPLLAPIHDVVRCLLIANAAARKTRVDKDPLHYAIWDLVDELVDTQNSLSDKSIFGMAQKETTKETATALLKEIPAFAKRLHNREFYLCLVEKRRRRILLKMFCLATFMANARKKKY